jgi:hypothetical protein
MAATYIYEPPVKESLSANPTTTQKGVKYRIYNIFKPTIVLDEISLPKSDYTDSKKVEDIATLQYPLIKINNYFISEPELDYMVIDCRDILPRITLQATFIYDKFIDKEMPKDGDIISVVIRNKSDALNVIRNDYVITGVTPTGRRTSGRTPTSVTFFGELFVPGLKSFVRSESFVGTSLEALKIAAQQLQLGFNTNDDNTDDKQIWLMVDSPYDLIQEVPLRSWRNENSFYDVWIDIYYNLNFVNVQKQLLSAEDDVDIGALLYNVDTDWTWGPHTNQEDTSQIPKVFSNYLGYRTTSFYITEWKPVNRSSAITFQYGATMNAAFFEHINESYKDETSQKYWNLELGPTYDPQKINSHILLRGRAKYDKDINEGELARANYNYGDLYMRAPWLGVQYTITNEDEDNLKWDGNHHPNYMRAQVHNLINSVELEKLNLEINVQGTNMNIIKGDKVPVVIIGLDPIENRMVDPNAETRERKNEFYSGWYYVKGFTLSWAKRINDSIMSNFSQNFILTRREWPTPVPTEPIPSIENVNTTNES